MPTAVQSLILKYKWLFFSFIFLVSLFVASIVISNPLKTSETNTQSNKEPDLQFFVTGEVKEIDTVNLTIKVTSDEGKEFVVKTNSESKLFLEGYLQQPLINVETGELVESSVQPIIETTQAQFTDLRVGDFVNVASQENFGGKSEVKASEVRISMLQRLLIGGR